MSLEQEHLKRIDEVIAAGIYKDNWGSLSQVNEPKWYKDAKFGIFIHWGVYSVPAFGNEWYPRHMYLKGSDEYIHHIETYGQHKDFGYKDFIPMFKGEKFNAKEWMSLFKEAGAKFVMPVAEHHDGFQMYDSVLSEWNAKKMGPKQDVLGLLREAADEASIVFCASSHRAENYWFFSGGRDFDSGINDISFEEPYGFAHKLFDQEMQHIDTHNIDAQGPTKEHLDNWLVRTCEIVDHYQPKIVWFDWCIQNHVFKPYLKKFAAYYYNKGIEWGVEVAINYKFDAFAKGTAIYDVERGQLSDIRPRLWQNDTAIAKNSWGYTENNEFKTPQSLVEDLIDIVSKNGCLLLNVGPRADGSITDEDAEVLRGIGSWLKVNGQSIYETTYWSVFGEGPTEIVEGSFTDNDHVTYTGEDFRFTYKAPYIYAHVMKWPENNQVVIKSLKQYGPYFSGKILDVEILGQETGCSHQMTELGLEVKSDSQIDTDYPVVIKVTID